MPLIYKNWLVQGEFCYTIVTEWPSILSLKILLIILPVSLMNFNQSFYLFMFF